MNLSLKDAFAALLTALAVLVYAATDNGWNVWLVGSSHRWAAGAIGILGMATCSLGRPGRASDRFTRVLAALGIATLALLVWALVSGSLTAVALLVLAVVLLFAGATLRHLELPGAPRSV
jgi:hypothetical protein